MRSLFTFLAILLPIILGAQPVRISGFALADTRESTEMRYDSDGLPCAVLMMKTKESGWTFDAGLAEIVDVIYGNHTIYLYIPARARSLSVARPGSAPLRNWQIPVTLMPGAIYTMKLELEATEPEPNRKRLAKEKTVSNKDFSWHFLDAYTGFVNDKDGFTDEFFFGLKYTYLQHRVGPYFSAAVSTERGSAFYIGAAYRFTKPESSDLDFHAYGGAGLMYGTKVAGEAGIRFAWKSEKKLSGLDFGAGCQFFQGGIIPTIEVGFYIWGIPVLCAVGIVLLSH